MDMRMRTFTRETYQILKLNIKNILIFEILYRLITAPIFFQVINFGIRFSLDRAGYSYLTMENFGRFLMKPWTIVMAALILVMGCLFVAVEISCLVHAYSAAAYSLRLNPVDILMGGIRSVADEIKKKNAALAGVILVEFLLLHSYHIYRMLTHVKPLNFLMKAVLDEPAAKFSAILLIGICIVIAVPSIFTIHGCMIEQKSFRDGMNRSRDLLKGCYGRTIGRLVCYQLLLIAGLLAAYTVCVLIIAAAVVLLVDSRLELAFLMEAGQRVEWVLLFLAGMGACILHFAAATVHYHQYSNNMNHSGHWDFGYYTGKKLGRKQAAAAFILIAAASTFCLFDTAYNGNFLTRSMAVQTEVTAHRGSSKTAPENTMAAVAAAVEEMAEWAEIDVQETRDGQVVLSHDTTLKRVTGVNKKVSDLTYEELSKLDAGGWFSDEYVGEPIPTLAQVMEYAKGKIDLNIEIKNLGNDSQLPEKVLELINEYEMQEQCVVTSTNLNYLKRLKELQPNIRTGHILSAAYGNYYSNDAIDFISIRSNFVTESMLEHSHEAGKAVHVWTVNTKSELERLRMLGVDNIITDYPVLAREILYREDSTENLLEYVRLLLQ